MDLSRILTAERELGTRARRLIGEPESEFPLLSAKIKLTWRCNLRCQLCRLWRRPLLHNHDCTLPAESVKTMLASLCGLGLRKIHFSGGEPLLLETFPELVRSARALGLQVNFTTNGTLLTKDMARFLVEERVHSVTVSIDSPSPRQHDLMRGLPGAWKLAWRGIENLLERRERKGRGPYVAVNTILTRKNIERLDELYDLLKERGVDSWRLLPVDAEDKKVRPTEEQWRELAGRWERWRDRMRRLPLDLNSPKSAKQAAKGNYAGRFYRDRVCFAPWFNLFVDADGMAYPCCMGKANLKPYGNALNTPMPELLAGPARRELCHSLAAGYIFPVCETCDDFLEENLAFWELYHKEDETCWQE
jgi:MoaA/NifB/PqqE/SkfB family radical SAM enzyme